MKVLRVQLDSLAERAGMRAGERILSINGSAPRDALDFLFATSEEHLRLEVEGMDGQRREVAIRREGDRLLGLEIPPDPVRRCINRCVFCFIDQNPKDLRPSLYVKDEDFRLSLLYGNYLSLTNLGADEIERILAQRMSPLYVSIHATDPAVRRRLLRCPGKGEILALMRRLLKGGIELHGQIVVVPGYNDGAILDQTLTELEALPAGLGSVAIVPVGLTRHRAGLANLRPVTREDAVAVVDCVHAHQRACRRRVGRRVHFLADEFYCLAGASLPPHGDYEGFPQVGNGVGMIRHFERALARRRRIFARAGRKCRREAARGHRGADGADTGRVLVATGVRFAPFLERLLAATMARTGEGEHWRAEIVAVRNAFFGERVTTAGLLVGEDLVAALLREGTAQRVVLPEDCLNVDGVTLDGLGPAELARRLGTCVQIGLGADAELIAAAAAAAS